MAPAGIHRAGRQHSYLVSVDELAKLVSEVRFRERIRGYHFQQVDAYVTAVGQAAAKAQEQFAELRRRAEHAESQLAALQRSDDTADLRENLVGALTLAQHAADKARREAREEAAETLEKALEQRDELLAEASAEAGSRLRDAEQQAARVRSKAETEAQVALSEAKLVADETVAAAQRKASSEIEAMERSKASIADEIAALESARAEQLSELRRLRHALDAAMGGIDSDPVLAEPPAAGAPDERSDRTATAALTGSQIPHRPGPAAGAGDSGDVAAGDVPAAELDASEASSTSSKAGGATGDLDKTTGALGDGDTAGDIAGDARARLEGPGKSEMFVEQLRRVVHEDEPARPGRDPMAAFFDDDQADHYGRWGRLRS